VSINVIFSIPSATSPDEVTAVFYGEWKDDEWIQGAGYKVEIPPSGVMPASATGNGKNLVHCCIHATYAEIEKIAGEQEPPFQIFAAQDSHSEPNPNYDSKDLESEQNILTIHRSVNASIWNYMPDKEGIQQTELHCFQGHRRFAGR